MEFVQKLPSVDEITAEYPLSAAQKKKRADVIRQVESILSGVDRRKLLLVGPCSADREDAVVEYVQRLAGLQTRVAKKFLIIPRVYTGKPRTNGLGYKGILHRPASGCTHDNLLGGLIAARKMHLHVIQQTGMFCVDEMLYPESTYYLLDLLACLTVGARSVENQEHRLVASGVNVPVGMKNPMSGDITVMLNSIMAAQMRQSMIYRGWEVSTEGNPYTFAILRGYLDSGHRACPNYHYEDLCGLYDQYQAFGLKNMAALVDCNHGNSDKHFERQTRIAKEVAAVCRDDTVLNGFVKGLMVESYLEDGAQLIGGGVYGKSITDPCLGWVRTERLILELAEDITL